MFKKTATILGILLKQNDICNIQHKIIKQQYVRYHLLFAEMIDNHDARIYRHDACNQKILVSPNLTNIGTIIFDRLRAVISSGKKKLTHTHYCNHTYLSNTCSTSGAKKKLLEFYMYTQR